MCMSVDVIEIDSRLVELVISEMISYSKVHSVVSYNAIDK